MALTAIAAAFVSLYLAKAMDSTFVMIFLFNRFFTFGGLDFLMTIKNEKTSNQQHHF
jgi:hypothetical protein